MIKCVAASQYPTTDIRILDALLSRGMTAIVEGERRTFCDYFIAPKRLSNEFDETTGAAPAIGALAAGAGAAAAGAGASATDGFCAGAEGFAAICFGSGCLGAVAAARTVDDGAGLLSAFGLAAGGGGA